MRSITEFTDTEALCNRFSHPFRHIVYEIDYADHDVLVSCLDKWPSSYDLHSVLVELEGVASCGTPRSVYEKPTLYSSQTVSVLIVPAQKPHAQLGLHKWSLQSVTRA